MATYQTSPRHGPYGARIWLQCDANQDIKTELSRLSKWGGSDKMDGEWIAWEFGVDQYQEAIDFITLKHGFTLYPSLW
jgi:hypothetical protein